MAMHPETLQTLMRETLGEDAADATIHDMTDNGGFGLVRWSRARDYIPGGREHIVHRWATTYTDGQPVQTDSGLLLYGGGYWDEEEFARAEFIKREDRPMATKGAGLNVLQREAEAVFAAEAKRISDYDDGIIHDDDH